MGYQFNESLKGCDVVVLFVMLPNQPQTTEANTFLAIQKKLEEFAPVELIKTDPTKPFDFSQFQESCLIYEVKPITNMDNQALGIYRASLNLEASATREGLASSFSSYIWSANCFWKANPATLEQDNSRGFSLLLQKFLVSYRAANPDKKTPSAFRLFVG